MNGYTLQIKLWKVLAALSAEKIYLALRSASDLDGGAEKMTLLKAYVLSQTGYFHFTDDALSILRNKYYCPCCVLWNNERAECWGCPLMYQRAEDGFVKTMRCYSLNEPYDKVGDAIDDLHLALLSSKNSKRKQKQELAKFRLCCRLVLDQFISMPEEAAAKLKELTVEEY